MAEAGTSNSRPASASEIRSVSDDEVTKEKDLIQQITDTKTWWLLKTLVAAQLNMMTEGREKLMILEFMGRHWSGHAPREVEFDSIQSKLSVLTRRYEALHKVPESVRRRRGEKKED